MPRLELLPDDSPERLLGVDNDERCGFSPDEIRQAEFRDLTLVRDPDEEDSLDEWDRTESGLVVPAKARRTPARAPFRHLRRTLKQFDVRLEYVDGWRDRGRDGIWEPRGVLNHHTASNRNSGPRPALGIVTHGRSDLPGPLSQFLISRTGTVFLVAQGRSNHAGIGGGIKGIPTDSGNAYLIGIECENDGIGEPWGKDLRRSLVVLNAVLNARMGVGAKMSIGHKEYTDRKIDPTLSMWRLRTDIRREMNRAA